MTDRIQYLKQYYQNNKPAYRQRAKKFREKKKKQDQEWVEQWKNQKAKVA